MHLGTQVTTAVRPKMTAGVTAARMGPSVWTQSTTTLASVPRATGEPPPLAVSRGGRRVRGLGKKGSELWC